MKKFTFEDFENAYNQSNRADSGMTQEKDDQLTLEARLHEAKSGFESKSLEEREAQLLSYPKQETSGEIFHFFWQTSSPFSQWHPAVFEASFANQKKPFNPADNAVHSFSSAEQYMMYAKAMLFLDRETAARILKTTSPREIKELGRQVKNFDQVVWEYNRLWIVYQGNKAKFTQQPALLDALLVTSGKTLVEAAPNDTIWGIGLAENDPMAMQRNTWKGKNLLGELLTQLRFELSGSY